MHNSQRGNIREQQLGTSIGGVKITCSALGIKMLHSTIDITLANIVPPLHAIFGEKYINIQLGPLNKVLFFFGLLKEQTINPKKKKDHTW